MSITSYIIDLCTLINHIYITKDHANYSPLKCALPNTTLSGGEWVDPNGNPPSCNTNPLHCEKTTNPAGIVFIDLMVV